jgi:HSP20 family protein
LLATTTRRAIGRRRPDTGWLHSEPLRGSSALRTAGRLTTKTKKGGPHMALRELIPWNNGFRNVPARRTEGDNPFLSLHREMNRLFDDVFRGVDIGRFAPPATMGWLSLELNETDKEVKVIAELPGIEQRDVEVELADGVLTISGEKKSETEDKERRFSERYFGRFERRIPVDDVDQDKVAASFKDGILTVTLPKSPTEQRKVKRIAINGK